MDLFEFIFLAVCYALPMYIANATPIIIHGTIPIDFGKNIGKERILGKGKTFLGALAGIITGSVSGIVLFFFFPTNIFFSNYILLAFLLSFGAIFGDSAKSFFKRRFKIQSGQKWLIADQIDFVLGGFLFSCILNVPPIEVVLFLLFITIFIHLITNFLAFKLKLKKVPW